MARKRSLASLGLAGVALSAGIAIAAPPEEPPCQGSDLTLATTAADSSKLMLDKAIRATENPSADDANRLTTWFGINSSNGATAVRQTLINARAFSNGATFRCAVNTNAGIGDVYAYVRADQSFAVVLAGFFLSASNTGYNSRPGVIIHELTHFTLIGATKDTIYGVTGARNLAKTNPALAQQNADNYEYFVEATAFALK